MNQLPKHLFSAYEWTDAAGELDELRALATDADGLAKYATESESNARQHDERDVSASDVSELAQWLNARRRPGRPHESHPVDHKITARVTAEEHDAVVAAAEAEGCSVSEWVREAITRATEGATE